MTIPEADVDKVDKGLQDFFDSLGPNDIYKLVFLEVLLEEIYGSRVDLSAVFKIETDHLPLANPKDLPNEHQRLGT